MAAAWAVWELAEQGNGRVTSSPRSPGDDRSRIRGKISSKPRVKRVKRM